MSWSVFKDHSQSFLLFPNPLASFLDVRVIKVLDFGSGERAAENRHTLFPFRLAHNRHRFDVIEVLQVELEVFPRSTCIPTVEIVHDEQDTNLSMPLDLFLGQRHKRGVTISWIPEMTKRVNNDRLSVPISRMRLICRTSQIRLTASSPASRLSCSIHRSFHAY